MLEKTSQIIKSGCFTNLNDGFSFISTFISNVKNKIMQSKSITSVGITIPSENCGPAGPT